VSPKPFFIIEVKPPQACGIFPQKVGARCIGMLLKEAADPFAFGLQNIFLDICIPNSFEIRVEPQSSVKACWLHPPVVSRCADSHIFKQGIPNFLWQ